jgi:glycosyltransferase involved in cell wall biosynthesis
MKISIIIPIFNEDKTILKVLQDLSKIKFQKFEKEVIVINDGSTDRTDELLNLNKNLFDKIFSNSINKGKGSAVKIGLENASGTHVVFHDADLEYNPVDLLKFEDVFLKFDADGIIGSRFKYDKYTRSHNILNRTGNFILTLCFNIMYNTTFTDIYSCYFAFKKNLLECKKIKTNGFEQHAEILSLVMNKGSKFFEVPINYNGRNHNEGKKIKFYHFFPVLFQFFLGKLR